MATSLEDLSSTPVPEGSTPVYTGQLYKEDGTTPIDLADLLTIELTFYNEKDPSSIINSRVDQNVLNNGAVPEIVIGSTGLISWVLQTTDTIIVDTTLETKTASKRAEIYTDKHIAFFKWTWDDSGTTKASNHMVRIHVENMEKIT